MKAIRYAAVLVLAFCSLPAAAATLTNAQAVKVVVPYTTSCSSVTIGVSAVEMTGNTANVTTTAGISAIKVSNLSASATVCCSDKSTIVCTVGNANYMEPIFPSTVQPYFDAWAISTSEPWYCAASAANTSVSACLVR